MSALIQKQRTNSMNRKISASLSNQALVLATALSLAGVGQAQEPKTLYPRIAPIDQYLMADQNAEIALARSAAPASISGDATIVVLKQRGYETAVKGKNGHLHGGGGPVVGRNIGTDTRSLIPCLKSS
jgi:hypothetical protein